MAKAPQSKRNYRGKRDNDLLVPDEQEDDKDTRGVRPGDAYRQGLSISELQSRFFEDAASLSASKMERLYGRDHADSIGFLEANEKDRPTSKHLRSPFYVDQHGLEYTPRDVPTTQSLFVRIPRSKAANLRKRINAGDATMDDLEETGVFTFPHVGEVLQLRIHKRFAAPLKREMEHERWRVVVADLVAPKQASAELVLTSELRVDQRLCAPNDDKI